MQFIDNPFIVDPTCMTYVQLFERAYIDVFLAQVGKTHQHTHNSNSVQGGCQESGNAITGSPCYNPYDKDQSRTSDSFREGGKLTFCLQCIALSHRASNFYASKSSCAVCPINCVWKEDRLVSKANKTICVIFNTGGPCTEQQSTNHGIHSCSL